MKVVTEAWLPETGLVTDALKLKRKAIEQKYRDQIEDLYLDKKPKPNQSKKQTKSNDNSTDLPKDTIVNDKDKKDL